MREHRKYQRLSRSAEIKYQLIYSVALGSMNTDGVGVAHSINLSEGGILFSSDIEIPKDSFLEIELTLPGISFPMYLKGEVTHAVSRENSFDIGIKFEYKTEKDSEILHNYVLENSMSSEMD